MEKIVSVIILGLLLTACGGGRGSSNDGVFSEESRKLKISGKLAIRMYTESNIRREETFYLYFNNTPTNNIKIKIDNHLLQLRPGVPGGYNSSPSLPYSIKNTVNIIFKKKLTSTPVTFQTLASATGTINTPVTITSPPNGFELDLATARHLTVSWSASSDRFGLLIKKIINKGGSTSMEMIHSVDNIMGNSISVPSSVFTPGTKYSLSLNQYMTNLTLSGKYTSDSRITNMIFQDREFETK